MCLNSASQLLCNHSFLNCSEFVHKYPCAGIDARDVCLMAHLAKSPSVDMEIQMLGEMDSWKYMTQSDNCSPDAAFFKPQNETPIFCTK